MDSKDDPRYGGFSFGSLGEEFDEEFTNTIRNLCEIERAKVIPPENVVYYSHGHQWLELSPQGSMVQSEFQQHSHEHSLKLEDIRAHRIDVIPKQVAAVVQAMTREMMETMFIKIGEGAEAVGNVVDMKELGSPALAFLEGLKRVDFGVDRQGNPSRPHLHWGKEALEALQRDVAKYGKEFQDKVDEITKQKEKDAIERNKARLARFKGPTSA